MKQIKVMHVLTDSNIGGAGNLLYNFLASADTKSFAYFVVLPAGSRLIEKFQPLPCRILTIEHGSDRSLDYAAIREIYHWIVRIRPQILHTHASVSARIAGRFAGVPVSIMTRHCVFPLKKWQKNGTFRWVFRIGSRALSDGVIAVAEAARINCLALGMDGSQIHVIINGVLPVRVCEVQEVEALREKLQLNKNLFIVGMAARLEAYKGQEILLRAAAKVCAEEKDIRFLLMGDGSERERYEALARAWGVERKVIFTGFVRDMAPYWALVDVNVNASYGTETSSLALSEGMSLGIPAIVSDYGGNPGMVRHDENGLLFPSGDADALARAILRLFRNRELYDRLSRGAKLHYEKYLTAEKMSRQWEALYRRLYQKNARFHRFRKK